jgi:hypothetical protein
VKVSPLAHVFDAVSATDQRKLPDVVASQTETCEMVSLVPPLVHAGALESAIAPPDAAECVAATRVVDPTETLDVPDAPGSPV